jgi:hypothetical protein
VVEGGHEERQWIRERKRRVAGIAAEKNEQHK